MPSLPFLGLGSEAQLHALADALPDGLFMTNVEGVVTYWNRAAERITGWRREEAVGRRCSILAGDSVRGCACGVGPVRCGLVERTRSSKCCTVQTKDGRLVLIVKSAVPVLAEDGTPVGALETFTEVGGAESFEKRVQEGIRGAGAGDFLGLVGRHASMRELYRMIELVARSDSTVMILGESGCGKERVADAIHRSSPRAAGPFVRVSCSALGESVLDSELFGHVKGAFPGALKDRRGRFQEAHGGTLLLDEIADVSPAVQAKLLRVIEQREIERLGDPQPVKVDARLLVATHRDLRRLVAEGRFRADLYFRLAVFPLRVPALRHRADDVALLAERFLSRHPAAPRPRARTITPEALAALRAYPWPGNVRELENAIAYAALQAGAGDVHVEHLPADVREGAAAPSHARLAIVRDDVERPPRVVEKEALVAALERSGWNRTRAAEVLGVSRVTLWKRMKRHGVVDPP